jgi:16S rRNA G527 N7-methylase RsmG
VRRGRDVELPAAAFDGVIARAFVPPDELVRVADRLLRPGGRVALMLARGEAPEAPGFEPAGSWDYDLDGRPRRVVVLQKRP